MLPRPKRLLVFKNSGDIETLGTGLRNPVPLRESVRSESIQGLSVVTATFAEDTDLYRNRQLVSERLGSLAAQLLVGITPVAIPLSSSSATVLTLGLHSDSRVGRATAVSLPDIQASDVGTPQ